jgi:hypothetical protein
MASREMFQTTDLTEPLAQRGIHVSSSQVYRLVVERPERLSLKVLMALLDILGCTMDELIEPIAASRARGAAPKPDVWVLTALLSSPAHAGLFLRRSCVRRRIPHRPAHAGLFRGGGTSGKLAISRPRARRAIPSSYRS